MQQLLTIDNIVARIVPDNPVKRQMTEFISWLCVLEFDVFLLSWVINGTMVVAITGTNANGKSMSGKIDPMFLFIIIPVIDTLVSYIISISSCICPVN